MTPKLICIVSYCCANTKIMGVILNLLISMLLSETTSIFVIGLGIRLNRLYFIWRIGIWSDLILRLSDVAKLTFLQMLWNYWHCCHITNVIKSRTIITILYIHLITLRVSLLSFGTWDMLKDHHFMIYCDYLLKDFMDIQNKKQSKDFYSKPSVI